MKDKETKYIDKNGKKIKEGDIVQYTHWWYIGKSTIIGQIIYENKSFYLKGIKMRHFGPEKSLNILIPCSELHMAEYEIIDLNKIQ